MSDTVFWPDAYPHWLAGYFPHVRVLSQGESGDTAEAVLRRCRPAGIVNYTPIARYLGTKLRPLPPGRYCSVLAGVNDLIYLDNGAAQITGALNAIYAYLRRHNSTPFPITILPWARSSRFRAERELTRLAVNRWIVRQPLGIDVEQLMGDGGSPPALKSAFDGGDGLHPIGEGPRVLARAVALAMRRHEAG